MIHVDDDELGRAISSLEPPRAREAFRSGLRSALVATAASEWTDRVPRSRRRPSLAFAWRFALAAFLVLATGLSATGVVAAASLPGDTAYPVKIAFEQVELSLAFDDAARVEALARQADRRLEELRRVAAQRPESAPTASVSYQMTVEKFQAAVDSLKVAPADEKHERAVEVADAAAAKHVEVLEAVKQKTDAPGLEKALERAKELERHAKGKKEEKDREKGRREPERTPHPTSSPRTAPAPTVPPRPTGTR